MDCHRRSTVLARRALRQADLHNRATKRVHSKAHLGGNERAEAVGIFETEYVKFAMNAAKYTREEAELLASAAVDGTVKAEDDAGDAGPSGNGSLASG